MEYSHLTRCPSKERPVWPTHSPVQIVPLAMPRSDAERRREVAVFCCLCAQPVFFGHGVWLGEREKDEACPSLASALQQQNVKRGRPTDTPTDTPRAPAPAQDGRVSKGALVGIVVAAVVVLAIIAVVIVLIVLWLTHKLCFSIKEENAKEHEMKEEEISEQEPNAV